MSQLFVLAFIWGFLLVASFVGFGYALNRIVLPQRSLAIGIRAALGLSFTTVIGGLLNLLTAITKTNVFLLLGLGWLFFVWFLWSERKVQWLTFQEFGKSLKANKFFGLLIVLLLGFIVFQYSLSVFNEHKNFHGYDDYQTYFEYPQKMVANGTMGKDPYAETRVVTSLGGKYFLDALVLEVLPLNSMHLIDNGVAFLILLMLTYGLFKGFKSSSPYAWIAVFFVSLISSPAGSVTSMLTSMIVFLPLCLFLFEESFYGKLTALQRASLFGPFLAAFVSLKSNIIPIAGLFFIVYVIVSLKEFSSKKKWFFQFIGIAAVTILCLLPWMISMYQSAHTFLYPILGKGYHGSAYGTLPAGYAEWGRYNVLPIVFDLVSNIQFWVLAVLMVVFWRAQNLEADDKIKISWLCGAVVLAVVVNSVLTGGYGTFRYSFAFVYPVIIFLLALLFRNFDAKVNVFGELKVVGLALLFVLVGSSTSMFLANIKPNFDKLAFAVKGSPGLLDEHFTQSYQGLQYSIPEGETLLARLQYPFLLDFSRNNILLTDYAGGASLPPGMPLYKGPEALADYLLSKNVKYVAYSYKTEIGFTREIFIYQLKESGNWRSYNAWLRAEVENTLDFQQSLKELGDTRKRIYDDGEVFVLDLTKKFNNY